GFVGDDGPAFERKGAERQSVKVQRDVARDGGAFNTWNGADALEHASRKLAQPVVVEPSSAQIVGAKDHALDLETRVGAARFDEAAEEEAGDDEQQQCQRSLTPHQRFANHAAPAPSRSGSQRLLSVDTGEVQRGCE